MQRARRGFFDNCRRVVTEKEKRKDKTATTTQAKQSKVKRNKEKPRNGGSQRSLPKEIWHEEGEAREREPGERTGKIFFAFLLECWRAGKLVRANGGCLGANRRRRTC